MHPSPQSLVPALDLQALLKRNNGHGLVHIALHVALILASGLLLAASTSILFTGIWTLVLGFLLTFLFAPLHETIHKTAFQSPVLNTLTGNITGCVILLPPRYFRAFHMTHHRHTQVQGKDPELDTEKPASFIQYLYLLTGIPHWIGEVSLICQNAIGRNRASFIRENRFPGVVREARLFLLLYGVIIISSVASASNFAVTYWVIPMLVGQPFLRGFLLAEHALCPMVKNMLENTRTTITNPFARWLCWNMNYHVEHHVFPAIPFHSLAATHKYLEPHIACLDRGYIDVNRQVIRALS